MKATLKFNLPDDQEDFDRNCKATDMAAALYEIQSLFWMYRRMSENGQLSSVKAKMAEKIWDEFREILEKKGINLEELYR